jgi:hypothetical protein
VWRRVRRRVWRRVRRVRGLTLMGARSYSLGLGIGWRPELALPIDRYEGLGFVEVIAEGGSTTRARSRHRWSGCGRGAW